MGDPATGWLHGLGSYVWPNLRWSRSKAPQARGKTRVDGCRVQVPHEELQPDHSVAEHTTASSFQSRRPGICGDFAFRGEGGSACPNWEVTGIDHG